MSRVNSHANEVRNMKPSSNNEASPANPLGGIRGLGYTLCLTLDDARRIAQHEAKESLTPAAYVRRNTNQIFVCANSWLLLFQEIGDDVMRDAYQSIINQGLLSTIKEADALSTFLLAHIGEMNQLPILSTYDVMRMTEEVGSTFYSLLRHAGTPLDELLRILRYPKRFTPFCADWLVGNSVSKMIGINWENAYKHADQWSNWESEWAWPSHEFANFALPYIRRHVKKLTRGWLGRYRKHRYDVLISSGTPADLHSSKQQITLSKKLDALAKYAPNLGSNPQYPLLSGTTSYNEDPPSYAIISAVPKNYKSYRIIAPEFEARLVRCHRLRLALEECIVASGYDADVHDQEKNRAGALLGSMGKGYSTADMSSASDRISRSLIEQIFPDDLAELLLTLVPSKFKAGGRMFPMHMFATSGNPLTFVVEDIVHTAVACASTDIYRAFNREAEDINEPIVFGDDTLVDDRVYETFVDVAQSCGMVVNTDKSYTTPSMYRESCGSEYYRGTDLTVTYWPRRSMTFSAVDNEGLAAVVQLEHRMFSHHSVRLFLTDVVRALKPSMTSSEPGEVCDDLWEIAPRVTYRQLPYDHERHPSGCDAALREQHSSITLKVSKGNNLPPNLQMYLYYQYLQKGPCAHSDPVLAALGFTMSRIHATLSEEGVHVWRNTLR